VGRASSKVVRPLGASWPPAAQRGDQSTGAPHSPQLILSLVQGFAGFIEGRWAKAACLADVVDLLILIGSFQAGREVVGLCRIIDGRCASASGRFSSSASMLRRNRLPVRTPLDPDIRSRTPWFLGPRPPDSTRLYCLSVDVRPEAVQGTYGFCIADYLSIGPRLCRVVPPPPEGAGLRTCASVCASLLRPRPLLLCLRRPPRRRAVQRSI